jgi:hypothetical protein
MLNLILTLTPVLAVSLHLVFPSNTQDREEMFYPLTPPC